MLKIAKLECSVHFFRGPGFNLLTPAATLASHLAELPAQYPNPANNTINEMQYITVAPAVNINS